MEIAIPIFDRLTALDAVGPYEVLQRLPGATIRFLALEGPGLHQTENGMLALHAEAGLAEHPHPDVVLVPGGVGTRAVLRETAMLDWLREAHDHSAWTTSVCTGSLLLAAAGILAGVPATTHWAAIDILRALGAEPRRERVVRQGKIITAAGVSAGIDMALGLAAEIAGRDIAEAIQLYIEYDPAPPFAGGSLDSARPEIIELARTGLGD